MTLTHIDESTGEARMVDVSAKDTTRREARAGALVRMSAETLRLVRESALKKGDALGTARIAGIFAAKRTAELIPLCHSLPLSHIGVEFKFIDEPEPCIMIEATAATLAQTGVEMEALTAATVAALTIYDMAKAHDKSMVIGDVRLLSKTGGKSGDYRWSL